MPDSASINSHASLVRNERDLRPESMGYQVVRTSVEQDKDTILKFWKENHPKPLDAKYRWMYENNPAGKPIIWILRHTESGDCVGMVTLFPRMMKTKNGVIRAGVTGDLLVNRKHRTLGPAVKLLRSTLTAVHDGDVDLIYTFPNKAADGVVKVARYRHLGKLLRMVKVLGVTQYLHGFGVPRLLIPPLSSLIDFILKVTSIEIWKSSNKKVVCRETRVVDASFSRLWEESHSLLEIAGERTEDYVRWKFLDDPDDVNRIFAAFDATGGKLLAYIVYRKERNNIEVREYIHGSDEVAGTTLMANFFRHARTLGTASVTINLLEKMRLMDQMQRFGFRERGGHRNAYIHCSDRLGSTCARFAEPDNWLLMASDEDT